MVYAPQYALVSYVKDPVREFISSIRQELHPNLPHLAAHLSLLPPRCLNGDEASAQALIEEVCSHFEPFEVSLGEVETFIPVTPTVFIRVAHAAFRMRELHDRLNGAVLSSEEPWPYLPHLTIVKMGAEDEAQEAYRVAQRRWSEFEGSRSIQVDQLTFVREQGSNRWVDLAEIQLGHPLLKR
ncbi:MAG: 2'-5' RNA ligase family protein [Terriglobales bacterium]